MPPCATTLLIRACIKGVDDDGVGEVLAFWHDNVRARLALIEAEMMEVRRQHPDRMRTSDLKSE